jgi:putative tricarboxylic transport membrane protein
LARPIVIVLMLIIFATVFLAIRGIARDKLAGKIPVGDASDSNPAVSLPISIMLFGLFVWAGFMSLNWPPPVHQFPLLITVPGALLSLAVVTRNLVKLFAAKSVLGTWSVILRQASKDAWLAAALAFFAYVFGMIVLTLLIGQKIALPVFVGVYLVRWGHYRKRVGVTYALATWVILVFFYDQVMNLLFHPSYLALWLQPLLPSAVPDWLLL